MCQNVAVWDGSTSFNDRDQAFWTVMCQVDNYSTVIQNNAGDPFTMLENIVDYLAPFLVSTRLKHPFIIHILSVAACDKCV